MPEIPSQEFIKQALRCSLDLLYDNDHELLCQQGLELAINAKLACYLQQHFGDWNVDVEYQREGNEPKRDINGNLRKIDIAIHQRGPTGINLCAMEAKGYWNNEGREIDREKLLGNKSKQGYKYAFQVEYGIESGNTKAV